MTRAKDFGRDLAVAYRMYPPVSKPAIGMPFGEDKYLLSEVCLKSFRESLGGLSAKIWVLVVLLSLRVWRRSVDSASHAATRLHLQRANAFLVPAASERVEPT
jgi:hypothetical protein